MIKSSKTILSWLLNCALLVAVGYFLWQRIEIWQHQKDFLGKKAGIEGLMTLDGAAYTNSDFDPVRAVLFWATWCTPCTVELARLRDAIENGELSPNRILAISIWDDFEAVKQEASLRKYNFPIAHSKDPNFSTQWGVQVTPTKVLLDKEHSMVDISNGIGLRFISSLKEHFDREHSPGDYDER